MYLHILKCNFFKRSINCPDTGKLVRLDQLCDGVPDCTNDVTSIDEQQEFCDEINSILQASCHEREYVCPDGEYFSKFDLSQSPYNLSCPPDP